MPYQGLKEGEEVEVGKKKGKESQRKRTRTSQKAEKGRMGWKKLRKVAAGSDENEEEKCE